MFVNLFIFCRTTASSVSIRLLCIAVTTATGYINQETSWNTQMLTANTTHVKTQKIQTYYTSRNIIINFVCNDGKSEPRKSFLVFVCV